MPGKGIQAVKNQINQLGYVQIDTIAVVERAHHHTLFSRLPEYRPEQLAMLMQQKEIFEYWSHAAAFLPMCDYRFSLPRKKMFADGKQHWFKGEKPVDYVLARIRAEGPLQSKDFEENKGRGGWYEWKSTKQALEQLFMEGKLMVAARRNFQKVYELTERVLPANIDTSMPDKEEMAQHLILTAIRCNGLVKPEEITYLRKEHQEEVSTQIKRLLREGILVPVQIEGIDDHYYTTQKELSNLEKPGPAEMLSILSPFDNATIQRRRLKTLFNFEYTLECYLPEWKRVHGYFSLPILSGDTFTGRIDCKAESSTGEFVIRNLMLEKDYKPEESFLCALADKIIRFAEFNKCWKVSLLISNLRPNVGSKLKRLLLSGANDTLNYVI